MASLSENKPFLHPLDIISFLMDSGGRTTNTELVQNFASHLQSQDEVAQTNRNILKSVTGHVATLRRQGSTKAAADKGGKMIVLRNRFQGRSAEDVWASLILSLSLDEISKLTPDNRSDKIEQNVDFKEEREHLMELSSEDGKEEGLAENKGLSDTNESNERDKEAFLDKEHSDSDVEFIETSQYDAFDRRIDVDERPVIRIEAPDEPDQDITSSKVEKFNKTRSVADLANSFNEIANTSLVSLVDHRQKKGEGGDEQRARRPRSTVEVSDKFSPLAKEDRAWLSAAMRTDYQTLARLARAQGHEIINTRDPATGYTALHWAAKKNNTDIVKLLAGTYEQVTGNGDLGINQLMIISEPKHSDSWRLHAPHAGRDVAEV